METPLLTTKLYIPAVRPEWVPRPNLIEKLNAGFRCKLILVSAPAGFGKTTLVAEWLNNLQLQIFDGNKIESPKSKIQNPAAWLSLDSDDNDPVRFLTYLIAALETVEPNIDADVQSLLQSPQTPPLKTVLTMLINVLTGLDRATSGEIWVAGTLVHRLGPEQAARWRGQTVGVVFQTFELLPTLTVLQNITLPMDFARKGSIRQQRERATHLLDQMEIADHAHKLPWAVSGGQQQRVAIARALANDPLILVADEPTGSLDSVTANAVLNVFEALVAQGKTVVLVTHDQDITKRATRTVTLTDGETIR